MRSSIQLLFFVVLESQMLSSVLGQDDPLQLPVQGTCVRSLYLDLTSTPQGWLQCQEYCARVKDSSYFTYNPENSVSEVDHF